MKIRKTAIEGLYVCDVEAFKDERGSFFRSYCDDEFKAIGINKTIRQVNQSFTKDVGSIRGMHYQFSPFAETKIVRCLSGKVFDVSIDIRKGSSTFLQWHGEYLSSENNRIMVIPEGFAHGFQVVEPNSSLLYLHTEVYQPAFEAAILYSDPRVGIKWPLPVTYVSERDKKHASVDASFLGIEVNNN